MKIKQILKIGWILILPLSCIDEINLKVDQVEERLVIDGLIADSLNLYKIKVKSARNKGIYPITNASVRVIDNKGSNFVFKENKVEQGSYELRMKGDAGRSYQLEVITPDQKTIKSLPGILAKAPRMSDISHSVAKRTTIDFNGRQVQTKNIFIKSHVLFEAAAAKPFLRWRTSGEYEFHEPSFISAKYCYVKEPEPDLNKLNIYSPNRLSGNLLANQEIVYLDLDTRFSFMYCFHIQMFSMNEQEYLYWRNISDVLTNDGTLYDAPPGNVKGNLFNPDDGEEQIIGYFSVSGISTTRYFVSTQSLGGDFVQPPCGFGNRNNPVCANCLVLKNSTLTKPSYWP